MTYLVRQATDADWPSIWPIIQEVAATGETFAMETHPEETEMRSSWMTQAPGRVVVATDEAGQIVGTANMYANRPNQGSHVASGSFMVAVSARGRGVGRVLVRDMLAWSAGQSFKGVQRRSRQQPERRAALRVRGLPNHRRYAGRLHASRPRTDRPPYPVARPALRDS